LEKILCLSANNAYINKKFVIASKYPATKKLMAGLKDEIKIQYS